MIVLADVRSASLTLADGRDFGSLKIVARGARDDSGLQGLLGARAADEGHVWLPAAAIEALVESRDQTWTDAFRAMLAKVEPFGWYDAATNEVKAHVEWSVDPDGSTAR